MLVNRKTKMPTTEMAKTTIIIIMENPIIMEIKANMAIKTKITVQTTDIKIIMATKATEKMAIIITTRDKKMAPTKSIIWTRETRDPLRVTWGASTNNRYTENWHDN